MARRSIPAAWLTALVAALGSCSDETIVTGAGSSGPQTEAGVESADDFGPLPDFRLVDQRGAEVTLASLRGRPLVIAALYSTCPGPCPSIARNLKTLQDSLADTDVLLVTVTVDPTVDTPEVLARYAEQRGADPQRWIFLTGAQSEVERVLKEGFFMAVERLSEGAPAPEGRVTHDKRLLAVDREGHRRGWYMGDDENQVEKLRRRMRFLAAQRK